MRSDPILKGLDDVGKKWTRQIKAEERHSSARRYRSTAWTGPARTPLKTICYEHMEEAWRKASGGGRLPTYWRQVFYVMRPICEQHPESDRPLRSERFKVILDQYVEEYGVVWDVLRGARGVFKEPHAAENNTGLAMSTMDVRNYLRTRPGGPEVKQLKPRYPTHGAENRFSAILICEKEGFDELLQHERIPDRYDIALMSTKGISARAARDLALGSGARCFTLHDLDKNGFVMAAGFRDFATDMGIRLDDVEQWGLQAEEQTHSDPGGTVRNLRLNGASDEEAEFIANGQRVELNMFTSDQLVEYVEQKLEEFGVKKVVPHDAVLRSAWKRAQQMIKINAFIAATEADQPIPKDLERKLVPMPEDLADRIREAFEDDDGGDAMSWDEVLWDIAEEAR